VIDGTFDPLAGDYAFEGGGSQPHRKGGGAKGGLMLGAPPPSHRVYEAHEDDDGDVVSKVTAQSVLADVEAEA
jgi:hypothetical protein